MKRHILGIDLGTSSLKICAVDLHGHLVTQVNADYATETPHPSWAEQNPEEWIKAFTVALNGLYEHDDLSRSQVQALALSSAAHIGVLTDAAMNPLTNSILWYDQRSNREASELISTHGDLIFQQTKNEVSPTWTLPQLLWIRRNYPEIWKKIKYLFLSKDYLAYYLTGQRITDPATAISAMLFNSESNAWSEQLLEILHLNRDCLPDVKPCTAVVGGLSRETAHQLALSEGVPVINGTLDSAAETYCAGAVNIGDSLLRIATAGGIHIVLASPASHRKLITYPHPIVPLWYAQAGTNACTSAMQWVISTCSTEKKLSFETWESAASSINPGADGLFFHPYLSGERCPYWDSSLRASFTGASFKHTRAHFARAAYEGIAFSLRDALSVIEETGVIPTNMRAVGGGTASSLWMQILCDVFHCTLTVLSNADSAYGAALIGLVGLGEYADIKEPVDNLSGQGITYTPNAERSALYDSAFNTYRHIQRQLQPVYHSLRE